MCIRDRGWYWPQTQPQQRPEDTQALLARLAEQDQELEPGRSTAEAVERGCVLMLRGFVAERLQQAQARFPEGFEVFLTGGDAQQAQGAGIA